MKKYELVVILNGRISQEDMQKALTEIEATFADGIQKKDDMWLQTMAYDFSGVTWNNRMYLVSYYLSIDPQLIVDIKKKIAYVKWLERYFFYSMKDDQPFYTMKELEEKLPELLENTSK